MRRFWREVRLLMCLWLLDKATDIAPYGPEKAAFVKHILRALEEIVRERDKAASRQ